MHLDDNKKNILEQFLDDRLYSSQVDFDELKNTLQDAAKHVFGKKKRVRNDWFDDQDEEIQALLEDKTLDKHSLRKHVRALKNSWFQQRAMEAEKYSQEKNHREFYLTLNAVYGPRFRNSHLVRSKNGEVITGSQAIQNRWVEHFSDLLNQPSNVDLHCKYHR